MRTVIIMHRKKNGVGQLFEKRNDKCRCCKKSFTKFPFTVIWKDCVECANCGYIWVLDDISDAFRYSR